MDYVITFAAGICFGAVIVAIVGLQIVNKVKDSFQSKQIDANTFGETLTSMKEELLSVRKVVSDFENDRNQKYGELSSQLRQTAEHTQKLHETTGKLETALAGTGSRGQWGERMAEDIIKLIGFIEGINYEKQKSSEISNSRPDYTFLLPQKLKVNMDVKFPFNNYQRYCECNTELEQKEYKGRFLKDVKSKVKEVTTRDYINAEEGTVDYVIMFIPNEQVYRFVHENGSEILDEALRSKVIVCSPLTLYAILAVIRQSIEAFNIEEKTARKLSLINGLSKQWKMYEDSFEKLGDKIKSVQSEFDSLNTTRRKKLGQQFQRMEILNEQEEDAPLNL